MVGCWVLRLPAHMNCYCSTLHPFPGPVVTQAISSTPTLRNVTHTGPWTWHGWQKDLGKSVEKSMTETMYGPKPTAEDVKALVAFLGTLEQPPNRTKASEAMRRGQVIFTDKARCSR